MDRIAAFLAMGGHGGFVWGAYGTAAVVLVALLVASFLRVGREERALERLSATSRRRGGSGRPAGARGAP